MLTVDQARERVLAAVEIGPATQASIEEAVELVVAEDIRTPNALPPFDNSAMDGYAVRAADVTRASEGSPVRLKVIDESKAGVPATSPVESGTAIRIMTGAMMPDRADGIVIVEDTLEDGDVVVVRAPAGPHVRAAGEDMAAGEVAVPAGTRLDAGGLAMLAACGVAKVSVHRRPRIALLVTGDELADAGGDLSPGQIRDSNSIALQALASEAGAEVSFYSRVPDDLDRAVNLFERAATDADLVVSSGGVAVGRYDVVRDVIGKLGAIDMWRVAMQPGKPVVLGRIGDIPFLGLPGNPVSVHISWEQFVRPAIRKMLGHRRLLRPRLPALLTQEIRKRPGRLHFVRVRLEWSDDTLQATPTGPQGSHIQSSLIACDGVALFPVEAESLSKGAEVTVEVWSLPDR